MCPSVSNTTPNHDTEKQNFSSRQSHLFILSFPVIRFNKNKTIDEKLGFSYVFSISSTNESFILDNRFVLKRG